MTYYIIAGVATYCIVAIMLWLLLKGKFEIESIEDLRFAVVLLWPITIPTGIVMLFVAMLFHLIKNLFKKNKKI